VARVRQARIKISAAVGEASYHCVTRTVNKERLFDDVAKDILRRQIWLVADFCGVEVLTYAVMINHFHVVIRVPREQPVPDAELLRRYRVLYPKPTARQAARLEVIVAQLAENGPAAVQWRQRQLRRMGDISQYMKLLKERFSIWFNRTHDRIGTLWAERFKSSLIGPGALLTMVAYDDLNSVRAGLVIDPKDYRFCGYAEAVAGNLAAQKGLWSVVGGPDWASALAAYCEVLFGTGGTPRAKATNIPRGEVQRVLAEGGKLPLAAILRCRVRYFTDGAVLGTRAFVEEQLAAYRKKTGRRQGMGPHELPPCTDWGDLTTLRGLRQRAID
jgi:REP element-mobilizing transposase RayT